MAKLEKKIKIEATITLLTGLHIGGNSENVEIGGIDLPVVKLATKEGQPYIPGSSLKGKMRCLLEQSYGISNVGGPGGNRAMDVRDLFGYAGSKKDAKPSRLIVRDAMLTKKSEEALRTTDNLDMPYTEGKWENRINRVTGTASDPRQIERVPAGAEFKAEFIINKWVDYEKKKDCDEKPKDDDEKEMTKLFMEAIDLLENDYLGGSGSRGYGQVKFKFAEEITIYSQNNGWKGKKTKWLEENTNFADDKLLETGSK